MRRCIGRTPTTCNASSTTQLRLGGTDQRRTSCWGLAGMTLLHDPTTALTPPRDAPAGLGSFALRQSSGMSYAFPEGLLGAGKLEPGSLSAQPLRLFVRCRTERGMDSGLL